jgi:ATP-dependent Lon protease
MFYLPPFLLAGGPGVGKTFFLSQIASHIQTDFKIINMEGVTGGFQLTGLGHGWSSAASGLFFNTIEKSNNINPIFLLDELDKVKGAENSPVEPALLSILEPSSAKHYQDEFARLRLNLSYSIFGATANDLTKISAPVLSRMDVFTIPNPSESDRKQLAKAIYANMLKNNAWGLKFKAELPEETLYHLSALMGNGSARDLRRAITTACAKAAFHARDEILPEDLPFLASPSKAPWDLSIS